ncbi:MAG: S8 family serine peptidase [Deltaproteobacteria bacterium]|nr:S8 family serine peptidase [Deltaproteobacteria bacterium]
MRPSGQSLRDQGFVAPRLAAASTGRGVRVAIVDSGVRSDHPGVRRAAKSFDVEWSEGSIVVREGAAPDRSGHGTACALLLDALAPDIELVSVRVTGDRPSTDSKRLARGIRVALEAGARIVCVPLGTESRDPELLSAASVAAERSILIAPDPRDVTVWPAGVNGAFSVGAWPGVDVARDAVGLVADPFGAPFAGRRRPSGPSFSAVRAAAAMARLIEELGDPRASVVGEFNKRLPVV